MDINEAIKTAEVALRSGDSHSITSALDSLRLCSTVGISKMEADLKKVLEVLLRNQLKNPKSAALLLGLVLTFAGFVTLIYYRK